MDGDDFDKAAREVQELVAALNDAIDQAGVASDAIADPQEALEAVVPLANFIDAAARALATVGAGLRARPVRRIWKAEELTLSQLATRVGLSKPRVHRMVQAGEEPATPKEPPNV